MKCMFDTELHQSVSGLTNYRYLGAFSVMKDCQPASRTLNLASKPDGSMCLVYGGQNNLLALAPKLPWLPGSTPEGRSRSRLGTTL